MGGSPALSTCTTCSRPGSPEVAPRRRPTARICALFLDVDGVLTDGRIYLDGRGRELKVFDTKDGHGMRKAAAAGITLVWISGRRSPATASRARELGVARCFQGVRDKRARFEAVRRKLKLRPEETAVIGDDEPDIPMFEVAGLSACPADATPAAKKAADMVLRRPGGHGAVRELIERILERNGNR
jgi:3-deoxy-D-manno-octulosonate 8-phosphate phosphatase (KDO 8-P phosphatase)